MIEGFAAQDVRAAEEPLLAAERGFAGGLMHRAATALADVVRGDLRRRLGRVAGASVVGLVGPGNNGGDTLHALAALARHGVAVTAVTTTAAAHAGGLAALRAAGGRVVTVADDAPGEQVWLGEALAQAFSADVVLDGLLGIGGRGALGGSAARLVALLGELDAEVLQDGPERGGRRRGAHEVTRPTVIAVDLPSGIGVDDGAVPGPVLAADRTVTFGAAKPGLLLPPAALRSGPVEVVDLGLRPVLGGRRRRPAVTRLETADVAALWPVPRATAHKYSRGLLGLVAGTPAYPGAAVLTAAGALGAGAAMVRYVGPSGVAAAVVAAHPEVVVGDGRVQAWVLGPGTGEPGERDGSDEQGDAMRSALGQGLPVVLDAGGLALAEPGALGPHVVLTPHAGELARLLTRLGAAAGPVSRDDVEAEPLRWARTAHQVTGGTVLLKGAVTIVVGDGVVLSQADGPAWLATAGAGDVLAGVLGAVLASGDLSPAEAGAAAALVHGLAAHRANPGGPVTAARVAAAVPLVIADLLGGGAPTPVATARRSRVAGGRGRRPAQR